ncbi:MAG TPA: hypothetical protein VG672_08625 [Bryobacteraceae bacterium]|nr:hypothetical protein [Bryobacteraceae bacterium]
MSDSAASGVARWRIVAGCAVLVLLAAIGIRLLPLYLHNFQLQRFVEETTQRVSSQTVSDDVLRTQVVEKAVDLRLPIKAENVQVRHRPGGIRIDIRYAVEVDLPLYTVRLHFYPGAGK